MDIELATPVVLPDTIMPMDFCSSEKAGVKPCIGSESDHGLWFFSIMIINGKFKLELEESMGA